MNEEEYIRENYGTCSIVPCLCLKKKNWLGTLCPNWTPIKEKSFSEILERLRNNDKRRIKKESNR